MGLFKTREEKAEINFNKGSDLISQGNFDSALWHLRKAVENGNDSPNVHVLIALLELRTGYNDVNGLDNAIESLSRFPNVIAKYGVYDVNSSDILEECKIKRELALRMRRYDSGERSPELAKELIACGNNYQIQYGDQTLLMESVFSDKKITGRECSLYPIALGYEMMADSVKWDDPRKASEYLQKASMYYSEANNTSKAYENEVRQDNYGRTAHCWFCGKEVCGQDIHFVAMPADLTAPIINQAGDSPIKSYGPNEIYVCRACFTAMDKLGKHYLAEGEKYTDKVANDLQHQINMLESEIASLRASMTFNR